MRILVVEDDAALAEIAMEELTARGHEVTVCRAVGPAIDELKDGHSYGAVLTDWDLGLGGCGIDVLRAAGAVRTVLWSGLDRRRALEQSDVRMPYAMVSKTHLSEAFDAVEGNP